MNSTWPYSERYTYLLMFPNFVNTTSFSLKPFYPYFNPGKIMFILWNTEVCHLSKVCHLSEDILISLDPLDQSISLPGFYYTSFKPLAFVDCVKTYCVNEFLFTRWRVSWGQAWGLIHYGFITPKCKAGLVWCWENTCEIDWHNST